MISAVICREEISPSVTKSNNCGTAPTQVLFLYLDILTCARHFVKLLRFSIKLAHLNMLKAVICGVH